MNEAIARLRRILIWSDRIGSDEVNEIDEVINLLMDSKKSIKFGIESKYQPPKDDVITRFEYISDKGRELVVRGNFKYQLQDDGKTLKVFKDNN